MVGMQVDGWREVELDFQPFSKEILNEPIPMNYVFPKIGSFIGSKIRVPT